MHFGAPDQHLVARPLESQQVVAVVLSHVGTAINRLQQSVSEFAQPFGGLIRYELSRENQTGQLSELPEEKCGLRQQVVRSSPLLVKCMHDEQVALCTLIVNRLLYGRDAVRELAVTRCDTAAVALL